MYACVHACARAYILVTFFLSNKEMARWKKIWLKYESNIDEINAHFEGLENSYYTDNIKKS